MPSGTGPRPAAARAASSTMIASAGRPAASSAWPRSARAAMVPGWSGPSAPDRASTVRWRSATASAPIPAASKALASRSSASRVSWWLGPSTRSVAEASERQCDDRGAGQPRAVQAPPGLEQDGVAPARPQRLGRGLLEAGRAGAQRVGEQRLPAIGGPGLQQRPRRRPRRLVPHRLGRGRPGRRLHDRVHPHRAGGARRIDGQQAGALQAAQGAGAAPGVGRIPVVVPRDELAGRRGAEHVAGDPVAVEQHGQREAWLGHPARQELVGLLDRQRPCDRLGGGLAAECPGDLILPAAKRSR